MLHNKLYLPLHLSVIKSSALLICQSLLSLCWLLIKPFLCHLQVEIDLCGIDTSKAHVHKNWLQYASNLAVDTVHEFYNSALLLATILYIDSAYYIGYVVSAHAPCMPDIMQVKIVNKFMHAARCYSSHLHRCGTCTEYSAVDDND